jgi:prepilin-type processing-associated H-X9-DG protein
MDIRPCRHIFNLAELFIVIGVVATLAAILLPVVAQNRAPASQSVCLSNEKRIGIGLLMYVQDYDLTFPMCDAGYNDVTNNMPNAYDWEIAVDPYVQGGAMKSSQPLGGQTLIGGIYNCPSFPRQTQPDQYIVRGDIFPIGYQRGLHGYATSSPVCPYSRIDAPNAKIAMWEVGANGKDQGAVYFFGDEWGWTTGKPVGWMTDLADKNGDCDYPPGKTADWLTCFQLPRYRHNGNCNFLFLDGHAKAIVKGKLNWRDSIFIPEVCDYTRRTPPSWAGCPVTPGW